MLSSIFIMVFWFGSYILKCFIILSFIYLFWFIAKYLINNPKEKREEKKRQKEEERRKIAEYSAKWQRLKDWED